MSLIEQDALQLSRPSFLRAQVSSSRTAVVRPALAPVGEQRLFGSGRSRSQEIVAPTILRSPAPQKEKTGEPLGSPAKCHDTSGLKVELRCQLYGAAVAREI